ncbi:MAG TPA: hypothetical protein VLH19_01860 [Patescibacteria group bacterium]|nr:hypothetical protein [Patescibacteria group bacterium]
MIATGADKGARYFPVGEKKEPVEMPKDREKKNKDWEHYAIRLMHDDPDDPDKRRFAVYRLDNPLERAEDFKVKDAERITDEISLEELAGDDVWGTAWEGANLMTAGATILVSGERRQDIGQKVKRLIHELSSRIRGSI